MNNYLVKCYVMAENRIARFAKDQQGVTAIEYALIGVAMATLLALILGNQDEGFLGAIKVAFDKIMLAIQSVTLSS